MGFQNDTDFLSLVQIFSYVTGCAVGGFCPSEYCVTTAMRALRGAFNPERRILPNGINLYSSGDLSEK